jgi:hypothetical protein
VFIFTLYHSLCEIDTYRERRNSVLSQLLIIKAVLWLEENVVPGKIDNVYEIPFFSVIDRIRDPSRRQRQTDSHMSNSSSAAVIETA